MADGMVDIPARPRADAVACLADLLSHPGKARTSARRVYDLLAGDPEAASWALEAERYVRACGCSTSAALALAAGPAAALFSLTEPHSLLIASVRAPAFFVGGFIAGAVIGKIIGLWGARRRFRARTRTLITHLTLEPRVRAP